MIRVGIMGYGNLGRGVEAAVNAAPDMELAAFFTRRDPQKLTVATPEAAVYSTADLAKHTDDIDVLVVCGGSATDLPQQTPAAAALYNVVDSFDTHANIPEHFAAVDDAAKVAGKVAMISCGWDPGMFSIARVYGASILPDGADYTFWGRGVSQGHSDAVRRISGVIDARQYTVPVEESVAAVRRGEMPELTTRDKHTREVFVVAEEGADCGAIAEAIVTMPNYFDEYDTSVTFISAEDMAASHSALPHGGNVLRTGQTADGSKHVIEYQLTLESNPMFTGSVLAACARATARMAAEGQTGCKTILDVPPAAFSPLSGEELRSHLL